MSRRSYVSLKQFLDENRDRTVFEWMINPKMDKRKNILLNRTNLLKILKDEYHIEPKYLSNVDDTQLRYLMSFLDRNPRPHFAHSLYDENGNPPRDMGAKIVANTLLTMEENLKWFNQMRSRSSRALSPSSRPVSPSRLSLPTVRPVIPTLPPVIPSIRVASPPRIALPVVPSARPVSPASPPRITLPIIPSTRPTSPPSSPRIALPIIPSARPVSPPSSPSRITLPAVQVVVPTVLPVIPSTRPVSPASPSHINIIPLNSVSPPAYKSSIYLPHLESSPPQSEIIRRQNVLNEIDQLKERLRQLELQL